MFGRCRRRHYSAGLFKCLKTSAISRRGKILYGYVSLQVMRDSPLWSILTEKPRDLRLQCCLTAYLSSICGRRSWIDISEKGSIPGDVEERKVSWIKSKCDSSPNIARNGCTEPLQERTSALSTSPPRQKVLPRQFPCFAHSNPHYYHIQRQQGPKHSPNCIVQAPCGRFEVFCTTTLDNSIPLIWTVGLRSISIHGYVDLRRSPFLYGKLSSIDLSSIDSNGIRSPCT